MSAERSALGTAAPPTSVIAESSALAVTGRGSGSEHQLPDRALADRDFDALLALARHHRLVGAVAEVAVTGELPVTDRQYASLAEQHAGWMKQSLQVERLLLRVAECLASRGIEMRVLKGAALARLVYTDPAWRVFADLDLLVPGDHVDTVARVAREELGGDQPLPELRPGFDREFGKEVLIRIDGVELDLHRTFVTGPFGLTIQLDRLFASSTSFVVAGRRFHALGANELFVHACYNAALGDDPLRLCSLRDLLLVHERFSIDNDVVAVMAGEWGATAVVQHAAQITVDLLGLGSAHPLMQLAALEVPPRESRLLRHAYLTPARSYRRPLAALAVIKGARARLRYARALVAPSPQYLRSRGWTRRSHALRALDLLRHRDRG